MHSAQFDIAGIFSGLIEGHGVVIGMIAVVLPLLPMFRLFSIFESVDA